jgi:riboflavin kinase/FMN adenylyltransferase
VHILDFDGDLYGRRVSVDFLQRLRDEVHFPDLRALSLQLQSDAAAARAL